MLLTLYGEERDCLLKLMKEYCTTCVDVGFQGDLRPEAIHLHGTDDMSTKDVFAYFTVYSPRNIEWINDSSCEDNTEQLQCSSATMLLSL